MQDGYEQIVDGQHLTEAGDDRSVPSDEAAARERRVHRRARVLWGGYLTCAAAPDAQLACTVANVSAGGAKILYARWPEEHEALVIDQLDPGQDVVLSLDGAGELPAEVVWCEKGRAGLRFRLSPDEVAERIGPVVSL